MSESNNRPMIPEGQLESLVYLEACLNFALGGSKSGDGTPMDDSLLACQRDIEILLNKNPLLSDRCKELRTTLAQQGAKISAVFDDCYPFPHGEQPSPPSPANKYTNAMTGRAFSSVVE